MVVTKIMIIFEANTKLNVMSDSLNKRKYIAVKPKGFNHYIWFETTKTTNDLGVFIGEDGWGKNGALTSVKCKSSDIDGFIYSDELQYS